MVDPFANVVVKSRIGPFEVKIPPVKKHMVAGHLVPTLQTAARFLIARKRRICIEVLGPAARDGGLDEAEPPATSPELVDLGDQDHVKLRVFRLSRKDRGDNDEPDDGKYSTTWMTHYNSSLCFARRIDMFAREYGRDGRRRR